MQWTIKREFTPDGGETVSHEIGSITRPIADLELEEIGLTLAEGHELVRDIERRMIGDQIHIYTLCFRRCAHCGQRQPFKDVRTKRVLTMFGAYRFRGHRIRVCRCQVDRGCMATFFPLGYHLTALTQELNLWSTTHPGSARDGLNTTIRAIDEFQGYVGGNRRGVPNFARARAAGWRISTAHVESVMNHLINHRLGKRQQMRWSPAGAHYLLQVRWTC